MASQADTSQPIVFVGGAPRSGTTVTHALLCTSRRTNDYHPEISYVTPMFAGYAQGLSSWDNHTTAFFAEREHLRLHFEGIATTMFAHLARVLGMPEILCVKDPLLTPHFPSVSRILGARARFVTVVRHPYDVVRSRQEVAAKAGRGFDEAAATTVAVQYLNCYRHLDNPALAPVLMSFRYEDMLEEETLDALRAFTGCDDISPENVWSDRRRTDAAEADGSASPDPWHSPKYGGAIRIDKRLNPLDARFRAVIDDRCGAFMDRFGYERGARDA